MKFKEGDIIKLKYFKNAEEYDKANNIRDFGTAISYNEFLFCYKESKIFNNTFHIIGWSTKYMISTEEEVNDLHEWFEFQIEKIHNFKQKIKFVKELL